MANCLPFNSIDHDRVYKAEDWAWYFSTFITNGIFPSPANGLQVLANGAMQVAVQKGFGFINGYAFRNPDVHLIEISNADGALSRIDRVVLRWDLAGRDMYIDVLEGTASREPEPPALTRSADIYELALADISVTKGLTTISQANITDRRFNTALCGICAGVITQIDASTLTIQFDQFFEEYSEKILEDYDQYNENIEQYERDHKADFEAWEALFKQNNLDWQAEQRQAFIDWLATIQDLIDEDTLAKLLQIINDHEERITLMEYKTRKNDFFEELVDDDDCVIIDDDGYAVMADWKYNYA